MSIGADENKYKSEIGYVSDMQGKETRGWHWSREWKKEEGLMSWAVGKQAKVLVPLRNEKKKREEGEAGRARVACLELAFCISHL